MTQFRDGGNDGDAAQISDRARSGVGKAEVKDTYDAEGASLAGIWKCPNCRAQIQIVIEPGQQPSQPFTCVCGTAMVAGDEH
jgi:hypothetical protein